MRSKHRNWQTSMEIRMERIELGRKRLEAKRYELKGIWRITKNEEKHVIRFNYLDYPTVTSDLKKVSSTNYRLYAKLNTTRINKRFKRWGWIIKICLDYDRQSENTTICPVSFVAKKKKNIRKPLSLSLWFLFLSLSRSRWRSVFPKWRIIGE